MVKNELQGILSAFGWAVLLDCCGVKSSLFRMLAWVIFVSDFFFLWKGDQKKLLYFHFSLNRKGSVRLVAWLRWFGSCVCVCGCRLTCQQCLQWFKRFETGAGKCYYHESLQNNRPAPIFCCVAFVFDSWLKWATFLWIWFCVSSLVFKAAGVTTVSLCNWLDFYRLVKE